MSEEVEKVLEFIENRNVDGLADLVPARVDSNSPVFLWDKHGMVIKQANFLHIASYCKSVDCVKYLIEYETDVNKKDEVSLLFTVRENSFVFCGDIWKPEHCEDAH